MLIQCSFVLQSDGGVFSEPLLQRTTGNAKLAGFQGRPGSFIHLGKLVENIVGGSYDRGENKVENSAIC